MYVSPKVPLVYVSRKNVNNSALVQAASSVFVPRDVKKKKWGKK